jgi:predicted nuclease with TOPRIM domain
MVLEVLRRLDKLDSVNDTVNSLEVRINRLEDATNSLKDLYYRLEYKLDNEITILHLRTQEHTTKLQEHDLLIKDLLPK